MGCQMNEYDSDLLGQLLLHSGFTPTSEIRNADLIMINTCAVRAKAEQKAYSLLGRIIGQKKNKPHLILGVMGCIAQQAGNDLVKRFPELDLVLGTREITRIHEYIQRIETSGERVIATDIDLKPPLPPKSPGFFKGKLKSYVSIMEGCNNFCSYCVVPYVRGREVSHSPQEILEEVEYLISEGVKEITLLGQNVNSYCHGDEKDFGFPSLLRTLSRPDTLPRVRFTTSHPKDLSQDLIKSFRELPNLCPHIHLPFQSGSNRILDRMNRGYTREVYMEQVTRLRDLNPHIAITSDVMVGFPGETRDDFKETIDLIKQVRFDNLFSFKYSDREGTRAEKMDGKIDDSEKSARLTFLQAIQRDITLEKNKSLEDKKMEVLVEGFSRKGNQLTGRTNTNKVVNFNGNSDVLGKLVKVTIKHSFVNSLWAEC
jgi:tRNA-2-methylthio-N6-dimethylallyladenosine synthase